MPAEVYATKHKADAAFTAAAPADLGANQLPQGRCHTGEESAAAAACML
jgi:hypothetical protein